MNDRLPRGDWLVMSNMRQGGLSPGAWGASRLQGSRWLLAKGCSLLPSSMGADTRDASLSLRDKAAFATRLTLPPGSALGYS